MKSISKDNTFFLVEDARISTLYKLPINGMRNVIAFAGTEVEYIEDLIDTIDEISAYILELSANFALEHPTLDYISSEYVTKNTVNSILTNPEYLSEKQSLQYLKDSKFVEISKVDNLYEKDMDRCGKEMEKLLEEAELFPIETDD